ncbi:SH3 domain-containing protein [Clostridium perfringens]|uniref:SH3 domain-containing protein n=1 Tax=Clostridium perfringens TaxID=1502 RepID=UPI001ABBD6A8|nr:SH3 domain-containing protein [Clostridium perfringens]MBO3304508.1 SH3 domain-containing protein [Clostridium perfringens]MBO3307826.1 SH3 domain-containing protein [Clostridium perfringens]MBO3311157.1 SH3 domain-containing protein [Clostridium perfringens]MBO3317524.1 SH3 domain-containing protein [Clostridium perfringens]
MANNIIPNVSSGDLVGSTPTFPPNAVVRGDFLYLRDVDGNQIPGRTVSDGDEITVLFISNEKNIVLVQYPTSSGYRQGYVTNATNIIKYKDDYSWVNGSTPEPVYDFDKTTQIGTLDPRERAVVLYKVDGMTYVAYDTSKGKLTKSGLVHYEGSGSSTGGGSFNGVAPGEVVPGGFTYENNAQVVGDELYLRDANGNRIPGRSVSVGDKITVLDVGYTKQLALVQYPAGDVVRQGYVTNATNLIRYFNQSMWHNGSTPEEVLDENGGHLGSLNPYEAATPLYKKNGMTHVVYNTDKGPNTKSGYVKYEGSAATRVDIPSPSITNAQKIVYGTSGRGRELAAYKVGNGANSLIYVCAIHGWEDHWAADGIELTRIGNGLIEHFQNASTNNWSLYIIPVANPDGLSEGYTNNGPGRCTIVGAVDCNRDFPIGFTPYGDSRHWTNKEPLSVPESRCLCDFVSEIKGKTSGSTYLIDMHGWEDKTIGDSHISRAFQNQFGFVNGCYDGVYQGGFLISWANSIGVRAALIELPQSCYSHSDAVNGRYLQKSINAVTNLIGGSSGGSTGGDSGSSSDVAYTATGEVINVQSFLNVRKGPGTNYDSIAQLHQGEKVSIVAKNGEWYKISSPASGYVHKDFILVKNIEDNKFQEISCYAIGLVKNASVLNVRSGPGTVYNSIGQLVNGDKVTIVAKTKPIGEINDWYKIKFSNAYGYVRSDFIEIASDEDINKKILKFAGNIGFFENMNLEFEFFNKIIPLGTISFSPVITVEAEISMNMKVDNGSKINLTLTPDELTAEFLGKFNAAGITSSIDKRHLTSVFKKLTLSRNIMDGFRYQVILGPTGTTNITIESTVEYDFGDGKKGVVYQRLYFTIYPTLNPNLPAVVRVPDINVVADETIKIDNKNIIQLIYKGIVPFASYLQYQFSKITIPNIKPITPQQATVITTCMIAVLFFMVCVVV